MLKLLIVHVKLDKVALYNNFNNIDAIFTQTRSKKDLRVFFKR